MNLLLILIQFVKRLAGYTKLDTSGHDRAARRERDWHIDFWRVRSLRLRRPSAATRTVVRAKLFVVPDRNDSQRSPTFAISGDGHDRAAQREEQWHSDYWVHQARSDSQAGSSVKRSHQG